MNKPGAPVHAEATLLQGHPPIQDLREWLARVEEMGELVRVDRPVNRDEEMSAISYLVAKQQPSPAVLFERPRGFDNSPIGARMLWNILGPSVRRIALTLEEPADTPTVELIRRTKDKLKQRIPPREVPAEQAPIYENSVTGDGRRSRSAADPAALAARRRTLCRHRRCGDHARSRQRLPQHRHLPDDAAGQGADRSLPVAGQGCAPAHHPRLAARQADRGRRRLGHRSACSCWWARKPFRRTSPNTNSPAASRAADPGRARQDHRSAAARQRGAGHRGDDPAEFGEGGRAVRRVPRLLRQARGRMPARGHHCGALPIEADPDQRPDGGLSLVRAERFFLRDPLRQDLGRSRQARCSRHRRRLFAIPLPRAASA